MASLAPHVSRVAKDYAPHGYSIYEDVVIQFGLLSATTEDVPILYAEDSDYYIEKVSLCSSVLQAVAADRWELVLVNAGAAGTGTTDVVIWTNETGEYGATALAPNVYLETPFEPGVSQILGNGESLKASFTKGSSGVSAHFTLQIRYRRKA